MKKGKLIQLRISDREKNIIQEKANLMQMSMSDYIRYVAVTRKIHAQKKLEKVDLSQMQECILDVDYSLHKDEFGSIVFSNNEENVYLTKDITGIRLFYDENKGYFLENGRSLNEFIK